MRNYEEEFTNDDLMQRALMDITEDMLEDFTLEEILEQNDLADKDIVLLLLEHGLIEYSAYA